MAKTWFVTGASRGFGRAFVDAGLARGDSVAATARSEAPLKEWTSKCGATFLPVVLDVTDRKAVFDAVKKAHDKFGRLDVVVNNAGYGHNGAVEEVSESEARAQMETNFFGALWVTQAALPFMRAQKSGHIVQISSIGGVAAFPNLGLYHASKWALEGMSEALSQEVAPFGINVTLIEPGPFRTDWAGESMKRSTPISAYEEALAKARARAAASAGKEPGDPVRAAAALLKIVDAEKPPLRLIMGKMGADVVPMLHQQRLKTWAEWDEVARATDYPA
jgi:NAD(P)-dependent dehydrogenase (short-subunit alcohol dehydrogenase family)